MVMIYKSVTGKEEMEEIYETGYIIHDSSSSRGQSKKLFKRKERRQLGTKERKRYKNP